MYSVGEEFEKMIDDDIEYFTCLANITIKEKEYLICENEAGLKRGDLVISANGKAIKNANDLKNFIGSLTPNSSVDITYERSNKVMNTKIKLVNMDHNAKTASKSVIIDGLSVSNLSDEIRFKYKISPDTQGVLVTDVKSGSKAEDFGFERGDVIVQVGEESIKDLQTFSNTVKNAKGKKTLVWINRGGIMQGLVIK